MPPGVRGHEGAPGWARHRARAALLSAAALAALAAGIAGAAPLVNHGLTINATPNPIISGDGVLLYGQLNAHHHAGSTVVLHARLGAAATFALAGSTLTNAAGFFEFAFPSGTVTTNRSWYVTAPGPGNPHSRTVEEHVASALTLAASSATGRPAIR